MSRVCPETAKYDHNHYYNLYYNYYYHHHPTTHRTSTTVMSTTLQWSVLVLHLHTKVRIRHSRATLLADLKTRYEVARHNGAVVAIVPRTAAHVADRRVGPTNNDANTWWVGAQAVMPREQHKRSWCALQAPRHDP